VSLNHPRKYNEGKNMPIKAKNAHVWEALEAAQEITQLVWQNGTTAYQLGQKQLMWQSAGIRMAVDRDTSHCDSLNYNE